MRAREAPWANPAGVPCGCVLPYDPDDGPAVAPCVDGTACMNDASLVVAVGDAQISACPHHVDECAEHAAEIEGVDLDTGRPRGGRPDPFDRDPANRSVSDYTADHHVRIAE